MTLVLPEYRRCPACAQALRIEQVASWNTFGLRREDQWSDGHVRGWPAALPVVGCPHCAAVVWVEDTEAVEAADALRAGGRAPPVQHADVLAEFLPAMQSGPPGARALTLQELWAEFAALDAPLREPDPADFFGGDALNLFAEADFPAALQQSFERRHVLATAYIQADNHRDRTPFPSDAAPRSPGEQQRRRSVLRALCDHDARSARVSGRSALQAAEWFREAGDWGRAMQYLQVARAGGDPVLQDLAGQMQSLVQCRVQAVVVFAVSDEREARLQQERQQRDREAQQGRERALAAELAQRSPARLLDALLARGGVLPDEELISDRLPAPIRTTMAANLRAYRWPPDQAALLLCRAVAASRGWPPGMSSGQRELLAAAPVEPGVLAFLTQALEGATWERWSYAVPTQDVPRFG